LRLLTVIFINLHESYVRNFCFKPQQCCCKIILSLDFRLRQTCSNNSLLFYNSVTYIVNKLLATIFYQLDKITELFNLFTNLLRKRPCWQGNVDKMNFFTHALQLYQENKFWCQLEIKTQYVEVYTHGHDNGKYLTK
jgi:hypothetical protein